MRRLTFYIFVALLTFGIGFFINLGSFLRDNRNLSVVKNEIVSNIGTGNNLSEEIIYSKKIEYVCENQIINRLEKFLNTQEFIERANNGFIGQEFKDNKIDCLEIYEITEVDLNRDERSEIIIKGSIFGLCNMRGNCELWGFKKTENGYEQILRHEWAFDYRISSKYTKGFADIEINANSSNGNPSNYLHLHTYNGKSYQMIDCFALYEFDGNKQLKQAKKVREKCE